MRIIELLSEIVYTKRSALFDLSENQARNELVKRR